MLILSQDGHTLANLYNLACIEYNEDCRMLTGKTSDGMPVNLGKYDKQRSQEILRVIIYCYHSGVREYSMPPEKEEDGEE